MLIVLNALHFKTNCDIINITFYDKEYKKSTKIFSKPKTIVACLFYFGMRFVFVVFAFIEPTERVHSQIRISHSNGMEKSIQIFKSTAYTHRVNKTTSTGLEAADQIQ